jgi:short-subunit dehydrogenase
VALSLARRDARVLVTARREARLVALAAESQAREPIIHVAGDLCDPDVRRGLVATAVERLGGVDLVISAAGAGAIGPFREADPRTFAHVIDLDFIAQAEFVRACLPHLTLGHDPAIVLVGSILGLHPLPLHGEYAAAKAAVRSLAGTLRVELAPDGIDVVLATLGPVASEFWDSLVAGERPAWSRGHPMSADQAATAILAGLEQRTAEIIPGWRARTYAFLARYLPALIDRTAARHLCQTGNASTVVGQRTEA